MKKPMTPDERKNGDPVTSAPTAAMIPEERRRVGHFTGGEGEKKGVELPEDYDSKLRLLMVWSTLHNREQTHLTCSEV